MKVVKSSFESLLEELEDIFIRVDVHGDVKSLVAGGINKNGVWMEYPSALGTKATLADIARSLKVMVYLIQEENKQWALEKPYHLIIREVGMCMN